jgi:subtilisin family serine protease
MANNVVTPPYIVNLLDPVMPFSQTIDWGLRSLNIQDLHSKGYTGKGVKIGIIDSGCQTDHPDLKIASAQDFTGTGTQDDTGHGTHVAGIIAAQGNNHGVLGVAPDAEIHIYKGLGGNVGSLKSIANALKAAINDGMDIINMSLGTYSDSKTLRSLCDKAKDKGIILVVASGNTGKDENFYPATYDSCIAVGAIDSSMVTAYFTTYGNQLDVMAPGAKILSTHMNSSYAVLSGTSMAAPFVSGCLALMKSAGVALNYDTITKSTIDILNEGYDIKSGFGILDPKISLGMKATMVSKKESFISKIKNFLSNIFIFAKK